MVPLCETVVVVDTQPRIHAVLPPIAASVPEDVPKVNALPPPVFVKENVPTVEPPLVTVIKPGWALFPCITRRSLTATGER